MNSYHNVKKYRYCYLLLNLVDITTITVCFSLKNYFCYVPSTAAATHQSLNCIALCYLSHNMYYYCVVVVN